MRVLLVDDELELVSTMAERLELRDFDVTAVTSGEEALERLAKATYDVAVVDVKMPTMSGEVLLAFIQRDYPKLPVILLTGHAGTDEALEEAQLQACATLFKPINIEELIRTMNECAGDGGD
ncbi:MAG: response regulator [Deltaproteobacteria bacterium]|jgi:DNA-binding NtrC family response regulator|nr:response regulator [Deltaproteobacteria bacterium]MBW2532964.1 response regulator [Deltaproteobacteria bacterium]